MKYEQLSCGNGVLVHFYGDLDSLFIPSSELPLAIEDICELAARHVSKYLPRGTLEDGVCQMASLMLPMFGLINMEHKMWMSPREKLTNQESVYAFAFRIRFCNFPSQLHQLQKMDHQTWEYLFLQLKDDFLNDRFKTMYRKDLSRPKLLGFVVVGFFIPKLRQQELFPREPSVLTHEDKATTPSVTFLGLKKHLPISERLNFKWPWPYYRLYRSVREKVSEYGCVVERNDVNIDKFKQTYMNGILEEVGRYGSEEYSAFEVVPAKTESGTNLEGVDIVVDPFGSRPSGIFFGTNFISSFQDVQNISLQTSADPEYPGKVQIFRDGTPKTVLFKDAKMAESFVSCVDGYRRLCCNFYYSLSSQASVEAPSLSLLNQIKAFGPMLKKDAKNVLLGQILEGEDDGVNRKSAIFLVHQSTKSLHEFLIVRLEGQNETQSETQMLYDPKSHKFSTVLEEIGPVESENIMDILHVWKKNARMIRPTEDCSLSELFRSDHIEYYCQSQKPASTTRSSQPRLFQEDSVMFDTSIIGQGQFTQVCKGKLYDSEESEELIVAIKQLIPEEKKYSENFQGGMCRLAKLQYHKAFIRLHGYMLAPPIRALMEYAPLGDLHSVMVNCPQPLTFLQIISTVEHLIHGLIAMEERREMHGNLRCRNLLVCQMTSNSMLVRIGDPGMESLYNTKKLSDPVNIERLPWIASERFDNLSLVTLESEIYSWATTCWEMLSKGSHPEDVIKEKDLILFYRSGSRPPRPKGLLLDQDDMLKQSKDTLWDLLLHCWNSDPQERPSIQDIQRSVYSLSDAVREQDETTADPVVWEKTAQFLKERHKNNMSASGCFNEYVLINKSQLEVDETEEGKLGQGFYGEVRAGKLYDNSKKLDKRSSCSIKVAVKSIKKVHKDQTFEFIKEIELASRLHHKNIVKVIGVCYSPHQQLVMEFVSMGSLHRYIQNDLPLSRMAQFCLDIAEGMTYLHSRNVLHRDLAARNVLLTKVLTAKITDFGLSRVLCDKDYYRGNVNKQIPIHWCSPEAIKYLMFTKKGDVWSYGVLMWEIFSHGSRPHLVTGNDHQMLKLKLEAGARLQPPEKCRPEFYKIMMDHCWKRDPNDRSDFHYLAFKVDEICKELAEKPEIWSEKV